MKRNVKKASLAVCLWNLRERWEGLINFHSSCSCSAVLMMAGWTIRLVWYDLRSRTYMATVVSCVSAGCNTVKCLSCYLDLFSFFLLFSLSLSLSPLPSPPQVPDCWLEVSIRKVLRPATSTQVFLGFLVSTSECWDGSPVSKLLLHASHVALRT